MRTGPAIGLIIVAVVLVAGVFLIEEHKGAWTAAPTATTTVPAASGSDDYYQDVSSWQVYQNEDAGFSVAYPIDFETNEINKPAPATDWRANAGNNPGNLLFTLLIPATFEPQTNFSDAKLTIGESANEDAVADCLTPDPTGGPAAATSTIDIDDVVFTVFHASDAGAGNLYDTTSYRAVEDGTCYAIEYTIHSTQLANYPESYNLKQFDEAKLTDVLDRVVSTFSLI